MTGPNRDLYSEARRFLRDQGENLAYVQSDDGENSEPHDGPGLL